MGELSRKEWIFIILLGVTIICAMIIYLPVFIHDYIKFANNFSDAEMADIYLIILIIDCIIGSVSIAIYAKWKGPTALALLIELIIFVIMFQLLFAPIEFRRLL